MNLNSDKELRLLFLGDSITEGFDLKAHLPGIFAVNHGVSGLSTAELLDAMRDEWFSSHPTHVFLCIGTNDIARNIPLSSMLDHTMQMIHRIRKHLPQARIFLMSLFPTRNNPPRPNHVIRQYNQLLHSLAIDLNVDYWHLFPFFSGPDGRLNHYFTHDGLHLTDEAYRNWACLLRILLAEK
ncbi:MAG TPA: GDSL-type esterase/lipase family protein [Bacteroidales bacterium]|nr:GDSL-type esterase/lipase family protein [Bacteroidales bacterium]